jgi:hypothetical protein
LTRHGNTLVASYLAITDKIVLARGLQSSFARLVALSERAAEHLFAGTCAAIPPEPSNTSPVFSLATMSKFCLRFSFDKAVKRFIRGLRTRDHWSIALLQSDNWELTRGLSGQRLSIVPDDGQRFYADPFLFNDDGQRWLFFEEMKYVTRKGVISCARIEENGQISAACPILERPYHLSYPFVFRHDGEIYMIPESGDSGTVQLYRAQSFPFTWVPHAVVLKDIALYDATLVRYDNKFWLFGAISHRAAPPQDELAIFYSESLEGPWHPHRLNPVKSDCRSARPAGRIVIRNNQLFRPAQDCESGYGTALVWCAIDELTPDTYSEHEIGRWRASEIPNVDGLHTFDCDGSLSVIDIKRSFWKKPWYRPTIPRSVRISTGVDPIPWTEILMLTLGVGLSLP